MSRQMRAELPDGSPLLQSRRPRQAIRAALVRGALIGISTGGLIGLFRMSHDHAVNLLAAFLDISRMDGYVLVIHVATWVCALVVLARVLTKLSRAEPLISGSGIPQTELALAGKLPLPWLRVLLFKFAASWLAIVAGLSLGREGPSVQIGGAVGRGLETFWNRSELSPHMAERPEKRLAGNPHIIAGAIAGLASAFGAPLAGILFAFEEMKCRLSVPLLAFACASAFGAHFVVRTLLGLQKILPFPEITPPVWGDFWMLVLFGVVLGWLGTLYNRLLLLLRDAEARQTLIPDRWRMLPPLACAGLAALFMPRILGGGEDLILDLGTLMDAVSGTVSGGFTLRVLALLLTLKILYSIISVTARIPGGLLMPLLCVGALLGSFWTQTGLPFLDLVLERIVGNAGFGAGDVAALFGVQPVLSSGQVAAYVLFGMTGFFAGTVRAPLTGIALVTEMSGGIHCLPGNLVVGFVACLTANLLNCPPVYDSLKARIPVTKGQTEA